MYGSCGVAPSPGQSGEQLVIYYYVISPFQLVLSYCLGIADIVGRRFGTVKLPYNKMKSFVGTISMVIAGFVASVVYVLTEDEFKNDTTNSVCSSFVFHFSYSYKIMNPCIYFCRYLYYYSFFGLCEYSWQTITGLFVVSLAASLVESLPISTELDDNLTVPLTSILVGGLIF